MTDSDIREIKSNVEKKMHRSLEVLADRFQKIRTGRATTGILESIRVDYYGVSTPISQVANLSVLDVRTLSVQPWEKHLIGAVEKAIRESDLGLNPSTYGDVIRVPLPPLTQERRKQIIRVVKSEAEETRVIIRNIRREANESIRKLVKDKLVSEDEERRFSEEIQKLTNRYIEEIDKKTQDKEVEVMTV